MEDWIAGVMAVLGTLLVLAGATLIVLRTTGRLAAPVSDADEEPTVPGALPYGAAPASGGAEGSRTQGRQWRLRPANQLLGWGVLLLVLASLAAGLITFNVSLSTGVQ